ncbi:MAG TPA: 4Fe-4S binding protein [Phycisphaerae bacterium]|nr:4Fe-4S binding protein [Phycisphaerae bacterium]HRY70297.1 4Fe-4S binding protein [Phycisphaerae bacterium]HSA27532.1 4Fe-4S binding protein [Phycisphaerae bacterium]
MEPRGPIRFKYLDEPLVPVAGTVDLAPFLIMVGLLALGAIFMRLGRDPRRQWLRRVTQLAAAAAFVIGLHPCACLVRDLLRGLRWVNLDTVQAFQLMMLIVPVAVFALMWGRVFCGWVCPIGFIQELAAKSTSWMRLLPGGKTAARIRFVLALVLLTGTVTAYSFIRTENEPVLQGLAAGYLIALAMLIMLSVSDRQWEKRLRKVRYLALSAFVFATVVGVYLNAAFCVLFTNDWRASPVLLLAGVLFASLVLSQAWCRFLCPEGALLGLLTRFSGTRIRLDSGRCSACNACGAACPVEAIEVGQVDELSCLYCCKCVDACPTNALGMGPEPDATPRSKPVPAVQSFTQSGSAPSCSRPSHEVTQGGSP